MKNGNFVFFSEMAEEIRRRREEQKIYNDFFMLRKKYQRGEITNEEFVRAGLKLSKLPVPPAGGGIVQEAGRKRYECNLRRLRAMEEFMVEDTWMKSQVVGKRFTSLLLTVPDFLGFGQRAKI